MLLLLVVLLELSFIHFLLVIVVVFVAVHAVLFHGLCDGQLLLLCELLLLLLVLHLHLVVGAVVLPHLHLVSHYLKV